MDGKGIRASSERTSQGLAVDGEKEVADLLQECQLNDYQGGGEEEEEDEEDEDDDDDASDCGNSV